jgi:hypothetical protein
MLMVRYIESSTCSEDTVRKLFPVLAQSTVYGTPPVIDRRGVLLSEMLGYSTLNEEYVVQKVISDYQARKKTEAAAWRLGVGLLTTLMGMGDGFQLGDAVGGFAAGMIAGKVSDALQDMDSRQLQELGLEWVNDPSSYLYHRKRHRGDAVRRLLMLLPHPQTGVPCTFFGVQFPDGYIAHLTFMPQQSEVNSPINGVFCMSGGGFDAELLPQRQTLGKIACDSGQQLPVEFWTDESSNHFVVIPHKAPHHSLY